MKDANKTRDVGDYAGLVIFWSRWWLVPLYVGLYAALAAYIYKFAQTDYELFANLDSATPKDIVSTVVEMIDMTLVGGLITATMLGGFTINVREYDYKKMGKLPRLLHGFNSTTQKAKFGMSLLAIGQVYLLQSLLSADNIAWDTVLKQVALILTIMVVTVAYGVIARAAPHDPEPHVDTPTPPEAH